MQKNINTDDQDRIVASVFFVQTVTVRTLLYMHCDVRRISFCAI